MFTGLVEKMGTLVSLEKRNPAVLTVDINGLERIKTGDSLAINGACLTVIAKDKQSYRFHLLEETKHRSNFTDLLKGSYLNVECPLKLNDLLGGHLVSGHLDGTARIRAIEKRGKAWAVSFTYRDREWEKFLIQKGSVAVNGVSLTITQTTSSFFSVEIIPHTLSVTNLKYSKIGERVNIELDLIGKYLYNFLLKGKYEK